MIIHLKITIFLQNVFDNLRITIVFMKNLW